MASVPPEARRRAAILVWLVAFLCSGCMRVDVGAGGSVSISPDGLPDCGSYLGEMCRTFPPLSTATIEATPAAGYTFAGFYDAEHFEHCPGKTTCEIEMDWPRAISAVFVPTAYTPKSVHLGRDGIVYLHDAERALVHRWDLAKNHYWTPIQLGAGALQVAVASDTQILFVAYPDGAIQRVRLDRGGVREQPFVKLGAPLTVIEPIGSSLYAQGYYGAQAVLADGTRVPFDGYRSDGLAFGWNAVAKRLFWPASWSLGWMAIDPETGESAATGSSLQDLDSGPVLGPLRWSPDGKRLFEGSGDLYDGASLFAEASLPSGAADAAWLPNGELALLRDGEEQSSDVERVGPDLRHYETVTVAGSPLRVFASASELIVVTEHDGLPAITRHRNADDIDGDGVPNAQDGFPDDVAASLDTDLDGAPDAWNAGKSAADSSTGLVALDAFPVDAECQLPEQARADDSAACDLAHGVPAYQPDPKSVLLDRDGVVHLLSVEHQRIFRWSASTQRHLAPIRIGRRAISIVYSSTLHRIYVAHRFGVITKIDLDATAPIEQPFLDLGADVLGVAAAGSYLVAGYDSAARTFSAAGLPASSIGLYLYPADLTFSPAAGRLFWVARNYATGALRSLRINTANGALTDSREAGYDVPSASAPIRVSNSGAQVLAGTGELYDGTSLAYTGSLPIEVVDATWLASGNLATLRDAPGEQTRLEHWTAARTLDDTARFPGTPLRVFESGGALIVVTEHAGRPSFQRYLPSNDGDHDGVANASDAFPDDPAASLDTDRDGVPDAWNAGKGPADSTTGLTYLDAFPLDSACQAAEQARDDDAALCDIARAIPAYTPEASVVDRDGVIHLLSAANARIYRWSIPAHEHLNPLPIGEGASRLAYSAVSHTLYVGYHGGAVTKIPIDAAPRETPFTVLPHGVRGLAAAGSIVVAAEDSFHHSYRADGTAVATLQNYELPSSEQVWDPVGQVLYAVSGQAIVRVAVNPVTGALGYGGGSSYDSDYTRRPPLRVSGDGTRIVLGNGDVYATDPLLVEATIPIEPADALWFADGSLLTLRDDAPGRTIAEEWSADRLRRGRFQAFAGAPLALFEHAGERIVATRVDGRPAFHTYVSSDDADGDGVANDADGFPTDPAASLDADRDGAPDAWNPGKGPEDSTTGLADLDAFPLDSACQLAEHALPGDASLCDIAGRIPAYTPANGDLLTDADGTVYALDRAHGQIRRWSIPARAHLNPIWIGAGALAMTRDPATQHLFVAYDSGLITELASETDFRETQFATLSDPVRALVVAGDFLYVATQNNRHTIDGNGSIVASDPRYFFDAPVDLAWDAAADRIYAVANGSYWAFGGNPIDPATGALGAPFFSESASAPFGAPLRLDPNGARILVGSGEIFDATTLAPIDHLRVVPLDAAWLAGGGIVSLRKPSALSATLVEEWLASGRLRNAESVPGMPIRIIEHAGEIAVVTLVDGRPVFQIYVATDDRDGDGAVNELDAFPDDAAASLDSDGDGAPDTWNPGKGPADSTTGLTSLDAFPDDTACQRADQALVGDPTRCDIVGSLPVRTVDSSQMVIDTHGVVYELNGFYSRIFRWSSESGAVLDPIAIPAGARRIAYQPALDRIYVVYDSGVIDRIDATAPRSRNEFAWLRDPSNVLVAAGAFLYVGLRDADSIVFRSDGSSAGSVPEGQSGDARDAAWSAARDRVYLLNSDWSHPFRYQLIDPATGAPGASHTHYDPNNPSAYQSPMRLSPDGARIVVGSGQVFDAGTLARVATLPTWVRDAIWLADGTLVTLRTDDVDASQTLVERWDASFARTEALVYPGYPVRLFQNDGALVVVTQDDRRLYFLPGVALDDADGDGVPNDDDDYPVDPAAALDSDGDGAPDAWNAEAGPADSTTGLAELDAFPLDSACDRAEQAVPGDPSRCDIAAALPAYSVNPAEIEIDDAGVVYLFSNSERHVFRWSLAERRHLNPIPIQRAIYDLAYAADPPRLHLLHSYGDVSQIDLGGDLRERSLVRASPSPSFLEGAGSFLFLRVPNQLETLAADGSTASSVNESSYWYPAEWNAGSDRVFSFDPYSRQVHSRPVDPQSGAIGEEFTAVLESSGSSLAQPLRVSRDGTRVLVGPGTVHEVATGALLASLPVVVVDALWLDDGTLVTLREITYQRTRLEHWTADFARIGLLDVAGLPRRVFEHAGRIAVVTQTVAGPRFAVLEAIDDIDGDGVTDDIDAFPLDPAASLDGDGDGAPDAWNPGRGPVDSTTGLGELDAFPNDTACQRPDQALGSDPARCDIAGAIPAYEPSLGHSAIGSDGVVYLLSPENARIYRWSSADGVDLDPIPIAPGAQLLALDTTLHRLYLTRDTGDIAAVDLGGTRREQYFASLRVPTMGLVVAGDLLLASSWDGTRVFRSDGSLASSPPIYFDGRLVAWDPVAQRLYASPLAYGGSLFGYWPVDLVSGVMGDAVVASSDNPIWAEPPVRVSADGAYVLAGSGKVFDATDLSVVGDLPGRPSDAAWLANGELVTLRGGAPDTARLEWWDAAGTLARSATLAGRPLRVFARGDSIVAVTLRNGRPSFVVLSPGGDVDGDGVTDRFDAFPTDPAASVDTDADGVPEAWNAGRGPGDSTIGLLEVDAFPDDPGCQLAAHAHNGICDAYLALPTASNEAFCNTDELDAALPESGVIAVNHATDLLPLCSGWMLAVERNQLVLRNGIDGRVGASFDLDAELSRLTLDEERALLYGISARDGMLTRVDLITGASEVIDLGSPVSNYIVMADGTLFASMTQTRYASKVVRVPVGAVTAEGEDDIAATALAYNAPFDEIVAITGPSGPFPSTPGPRLVRYRADTDTHQLVEIQHLDLGSSYLISADPVVSPDGARIVVTFPNYLLGATSVVEYDAADLARVPRQWEGEPFLFSFDPGGTRVVKADPESLAILEVDDFEVLASRPLDACVPVASTGTPVFSRGGSLVFTTQQCAPDPLGARLVWLRAD